MPSLTTFMKPAPLTFTEITEPLDGDDWIRTVEAKLELVNYTDHEKVVYASSFHDGSANACWESVTILCLCKVTL